MSPITHETVDHFIQLSGPLFEDVQQSGIFADSKTFVDSVPNTAPTEIHRQYEKQRRNQSFDLKTFVTRHFKIPEQGVNESFKPAGSMSMYEHINRLWDYLSREPDDHVPDNSTLIPLPYPYIVPGGRFREIYYWDTYFTAEGLAVAGRLDTVENLTRNFAWLVDHLGHVPNGNRYYYVSRSQPPFLVLLVDLIARYRGEEAIQEFIPALEKEYAFWMDGSEKLAEGGSHRRVLNLDGALLNRYWDDRPLPREESWREDYELAAGLNAGNMEDRYRHLRAGAESGWDFSSRWFRDGKNLDTIRTTEILPVDLNALLYYLEIRLGEWTSGEHYLAAAGRRKTAFDRYFWNEEAGYYFDYDWKSGAQTGIWSMAGAYPLFLHMASPEKAKKAGGILREKFLNDGGMVSTLHNTGQQWDAPNGWAPLQWIAVKGLINYGQDELARTAAGRWLELNESVFGRTGKMMEKYNVCDLSLQAGGGEYPLQDGFGWTNGVAAALGKLLRD